MRTVTIRDGRLICSCPFTDVYGLVCIHAVTVANTFHYPNGPCEKENSIIWSKRYTELGLNCDESKYCPQKMMNTLISIRDKEELGIRIGHASISHIPILRYKDVPDHFNFDNEQYEVMNPLNYTISEYGEHINAPSGHNQQVMTYSEDGGVDDDELDFNIFSHDNPSSSQRNQTCRTPYNQIAPSFKELMNHMELNTTKDEIREVKRFLDRKLMEVKMRINRMSNKSKQSGTYVSSGVAFSNRSKPHGCDGYRRKRKKTINV